MSNRKFTLLLLILSLVPLVPIVWLNSLDWLSSVSHIEASDQTIIHPSVNIPPGTPRLLAQAIIDAYNAPPPALMAWDGGVHYKVTPSMRRIAEFEDSAIPVLLANLDNDKLTFVSIILLGELRAEEAVPVFLNSLDMCISGNDSFIVAALCEITGNPNKSYFLDGWFLPKVRQRAVREFQQWRPENEKKSWWIFQ